MRDILELLAEAGSMSVVDLAGRLGAEQRSVRRAVAGLEERGMVTISREPIWTMRVDSSRTASGTRRRRVFGTVATLSEPSRQDRI